MIESCARDARVCAVEWMSWERILEFAAKYGYGFLFVISVAENTFLVGLVVPGDVAVVLGGGLAAQARLDVTLVIVAVMLGVLLGSLLSFWIGRQGGIPLIERWGTRFALERRKNRKGPRVLPSARRQDRLLRRRSWQG